MSQHSVTRSASKTYQARNTHFTATKITEMLQ